ncbi:DNA helicase HerA, contains HAS-barrel and ATPase domains [Lachnospiraceae bacterium XBD2001]|nr:DNA helicase HerA, contains HAS-barrel and ATPase domains [Lachnospiraceae bacterium XBD2001]
MGIISNAKQFLARKTVAAAQKSGDGIATLSSLSPKQLHEIEKRREDYFKIKKDLNSDETQQLIQRNLGAVGIEVYQAYLDSLREIYTPLLSVSDDFDSDNRIRFFDVTKWVVDDEEQSLDKLVNVYQVLSEEDCNIALIYHRTVDDCRITIGVVNTNERESDPAIADKYYSRMLAAIKGNFPGAEIQSQDNMGNDYGVGIPTVLENIVSERDDNKSKSVAVVSNIASEKSEDFISQSMEKLLDGIVPTSPDQEYIMILLAKPMRNQLETKNRLYDLYSALAPYESWRISSGVSENSTEGSSFNLGGNIGGNISKSSGVNAGLSVPTPAGIAGVGASQGHSYGINFGVSFARSSNVSVTLGKHEELSQTYTNHGVKHTLEIIEDQIKRIEESSALGMWEFASYIISDSPVIANNVAHMYLALTQGEKSYLSKAAINFWDGEVAVDSAKTILLSVQNLQHPVFGLKTSLEDEWLMYPSLVTPTTLLSGKELAKSLNFPRKSVAGLPVIECASFGRDVQRFSDKSQTSPITIGSVYHMYNDEKKSVVLDADSFTSHVFVTGSTGTGKTTTTLQLLSKIISADKTRKFLVIEPVKGEYKTKIGGKCKVYGTNPTITDDLLKLNPFWFPENIHVLEHIDRLIEILNACWPMYAAMPAVLKDAVERAYVNVGWNLSGGRYIDEFPTFYDLLDTLPEVLEDSMYSKDTKSDYAGALITRVKTLTNGLNKSLFCDKVGINEQDLFENNVIVDISRIGSPETKSLIMGILMLKLQEYWINKDEFNNSLKHITVLEEAHNLLRKTSTVQSQENSNIQGKAVEMLTNAIAEMRAYGEGFVIADQAPGLLDEAVIRNTNTKIILRLPDKDDREIVGASCSLNDNQIDEIGKLPDYTAVVYQNDWVEAVLCHFENFTEGCPYVKQKNNDSDVNLFAVERYLHYLFSEGEKIELTKEDRVLSLEWVDTLQAGIITKRELRKALAEGAKNRGILAYNLFRGKVLSHILEDTFDEQAGVTAVKKRIQSQFDIADNHLVDEICRLIIIQICDLKKDGTIVERYREIAEGGGFNW